MADVRTLGAGDEAVLDSVAPGVFDQAIVPALAADFLGDPRHHMTVAIDDGMVVGMASAVHYIHPDKHAELWINEVGVTPTHRRLRLAQRLLNALLAEGRAHGCRAAWVLTEGPNEPARRLYETTGGVEVLPETVMYEFTLGEDDG